MKHTRKQIMAKRLAAHAAREMKPFKAPIIVDGIYCRPFHTGKRLGHVIQIISNCTGRPVEMSGLGDGKSK